MSQFLDTDMNIFGMQPVVLQTMGQASHEYG